MVIDTDGSAFITKAEFDSLKNNFQSQIDNYNSSIDSKIDGAIASYLSGIKVSTFDDVMIPWPGGVVSFCEPVDVKIPKDQFNLDYEYLTFNSGGKKSNKIKYPVVCSAEQESTFTNLLTEWPDFADSEYRRDYIQCEGADPTSNWVNHFAAYLGTFPEIAGSDYAADVDQDFAREKIEKNTLHGVWFVKTIGNKHILQGQTSIYISPLSAFLYSGKARRWAGTTKTQFVYDYITGQARFPRFSLSTPDSNSSNYANVVLNDSTFNIEYELKDGKFIYGITRNFSSYAGSAGYWPNVKVAEIGESAKNNGSYNSNSSYICTLSPPTNQIIPSGQLVSFTATNTYTLRCDFNEYAKTGARYNDPKYQVLFPTDKLWCKGTSNFDGTTKLSLFDENSGWLISKLEEIPANTTDAGTQFKYIRGNGGDLWSRNTKRPEDGTVIFETPTLKISADDDELYEIGDVYCELYSSDAMAQYGKSFVDGAIICKISDGKNDVTLQFTISTDTNTEIIFNKGAFSNMNAMGNISVNCGDTEYNCSTSTIPLSAGSSKTFVVNNVNSGEMYFVKPTSACTLNITNAAVLMDK